MLSPPPAPRAFSSTFGSTRSQLNRQESSQGRDTCRCFFFFLIKKNIRKENHFPGCAVMRLHWYVKHAQKQEKDPTSCLHGPLCGSLKPLLGYEKGITDLPLFFLEDSATSSSLVHDVHTGSWALQDFASGRSRGGSLGCTLLPSLPGSWSLGLGRQSPSVGEG